MRCGANGTATSPSTCGLGINERSAAERTTEERWGLTPESGPVSSRPMSGGFASSSMASGLHAVRGSAVRPLRRPLLVRGARGAATSRRSSSISAPGLRPYGARLRDGQFHGTALLSHLHWDHVQGMPFFVPLHIPGNDARRARPAPGRRPARRRVRADDAAAVLPDPADGPRRRGPLPRHRRRRLPDRPGQGALALGSPRRADARVPGRVERHARSRTSPTTVRERSRRRRRLRAARSARAVRRRRPAHPRRAAHAATSTSRSGTGVTAPSTTRCSSRGRPACAASRALPPRPDSRRRRPRIASAATRRELAPRMGVPELIVAATACRSSSPRTRRTARAGVDEPFGTAPARSRRRDLSAPCSVTSPPGVALDHRVRRRRTGRDGVQLVHVGVARAAARAVLRGEVVDHLAAHPVRGQVGRELPRRGRRGDLPAVRAEGRRPLRTGRVLARAAPARRSSTRRSRSSTARPSPSTTPATT